MKIAVKSLLICAVLVFLGACSSSSSDGEDGSTVTLSRDLNGVWTTGCLVEAPFSVRLQISINNGVVSITETEYADAACSNVLEIDNTISWTFTLGDSVALDGLVAGILNATQIDISVTAPASLAGDRAFDIIAIQGNRLYVGDTDGANDGSSADLRPTQLDDELVFTRATANGVVINLAELNGTWSSTCFVNAASSIKVLYQISNGTVVAQGITYADTGCNAVQMTETVNLSFSLGSAVSLSGGVAGIRSATELNSTVTSGIDTGLITYDLVAIQGDQLYLGDTDGFNDGSTPGLRPIQLDGDFPLVRLP